MGARTHAHSLSSMSRIVLDTNCLLQILPSKSPFHKIWENVLSGGTCLCVNSEILYEYEEILSQKTTPGIAHNVVEAIARLHTTVFQETHIHFALIKQDVDDNKFVDCAIVTGARYVVTNDSHFDILRQIDWPKVDIITLKDFMKETVAKSHSQQDDGKK